VKHIKVFRTLTLAIILALLMLAIPVTPVLAAERISVTPTSGEIDDYVDIDCSGFTAGEDVYFYFSSEDIDVDDELDDLDAYERVEIEYDCDSSFDTYFYVPDRLTDGDDTEDVESGDYYVYAAYEDDEIVAKDDFRVSIIEVSISPDEGIVGTEVEIEGSGFDDREDIEITFGTTSIDIDSGDTETDSRGEFTCTITIPEATAGDHTITVEVRYDEGEAEFTVEPEISISPTSGAVGESVTVSGTGFGYSEDITITFDGDDVDITGDDETGTYGSFEASFNVPSVGPGTYDVEVEDDDNNSASAEFKIATYAEMSPTTGNVGTQITVTGSGFAAGGTATVDYDGTEVTTASIASDGTFQATFSAPASKSGNHTVYVSDGTSTEEFTFTMESTPPETPPPLLPYMGDKTDSEAHFDWEDATDESLPVTYDLQIATDAEFTNKLVNKTGLTTSEYTLTEAEKLESTGKDAPYYWRVRAVDAASNPSQWTGAGEFTVGFMFGIPKLEGWVLYVLIGVGAIVLFFIGLLVGRRVGGGGGGYY
jgi:hypothetical protein